MASGCILSECKYCGEFIWEDEDYDFINDMVFFHKECKNKYSYNQILETENRKLLRENLALKEKLENINKINV